MSTILSYSPLNLCFFPYFPNLGSHPKSITSYFLFLTFELLVFVSIREKIAPCSWKFVKG
jgi:hypothetical protein